MAEDFSDATLLIVGHGSQRNTGSGHATRRLAKTLADKNLFADVRAAFLREEPFLNGILDTIDSPRVFVVPNMASKGYLTETQIPTSLGLTGQTTERITPTGRQKIVLTDPLGVQSGLLGLAAHAVADVVNTHTLSRDETAVLVAGHGNPSNPENADQTRRVANRVRDEQLAQSVRCGFLEEAPFIRDWQGDIAQSNVIVMPFLISGGVHGAGDIPELMGIDPDDPTLARLLDDLDVAGPYDVDGRRIFYIRPIGLATGVADVVLNMVKNA